MDFLAEDVGALQEPDTTELKPGSKNTAINLLWRRRLNGAEVDAEDVAKAAAQGKVAEFYNEYKPPNKK